MEWTREKTLLLIEEYNNRPGLWDMSHDDYRKKDVKKELLEEVTEKLDGTIPASDIEKKFHTLRTQYHREICRMNTGRGSEPYKSKWFAFRHLEFLSSPSACRSKDQRRRKLIYIPEVKPETSGPTVHNVQVTVRDKSGVETRKDVRVLFENEDDEKNDDEEESSDTKLITTQIQYVPEVAASKSANSSGYDDEQLVVLQKEVEPEPDDTQFLPAASLDVPKVVKVDLQHSSNSGNRSHDAYEQIVFETTGHSHSAPKKLCKDQGSSTMLPPMQLSVMRDEFATFGECVANELRFITDRQILVRVKHKINTALFEANVAQLQKNE